MLFCQVWITRRATRYNLTKHQTFLLEKQHGSNSGLTCSLVFWMSLYKGYHSSGLLKQNHNILNHNPTTTHSIVPKVLNLEHGLGLTQSKVTHIQILS